MPVVTPARPPARTVPGRRGSRLGPALLAAAVIALLVVVLVPLTRQDESPRPLDTTSLVPQIDAVDGTEVVPARLTPPPAAGSVLRIDGPFDDETRLEQLTLVNGPLPRLTGTVQIVRDVSDLIVMELQAAWYDGDGALIDTGRLVLEQSAFTRAFEAGQVASEVNGALPFTIEAPPAIATRVTSAGINVAVLVNE